MKLPNCASFRYPKGRQILAEMTVLENLELGAYLEKDSNEK